MITAQTSAAKDAHKLQLSPVSLTTMERFCTGLLGRTLMFTKEDTPAKHAEYFLTTIGNLLLLNLAVIEPRPGRQKESALLSDEANSPMVSLSIVSGSPEISFPSIWRNWILQVGDGITPTVFTKKIFDAYTPKKLFQHLRRELLGFRIDTTFSKFSIYPEPAAHTVDLGVRSSEVRRQILSSLNWPELFEKLRATAEPLFFKRATLVLALNPRKISGEFNELVMPKHGHNRSSAVEAASVERRVKFKARFELDSLVESYRLHIKTLQECFTSEETSNLLTKLMVHPALAPALDFSKCARRSKPQASDGS